MVAERSGDAPSAESGRPVSLPALDGIRGLAALGVVFGHLPYVHGFSLFNSMKDIESRIPFGHLCMDLFFALSGFLITRIILAEKEEGKFSLRRFYIRRSVRILPIYYLSLIACVFFFDLDTAETRSIAFFCSNYFYSIHHIVSPLKHTWSLAVEEHFYLLWPLVLFFLDKRRASQVARFWIPGIAFAFALLLEWVSGDRVTGDLLTRGTQFRMLSLSLGAAMAFQEHENPASKWRSIGYASLWTLFALACIAAFRIAPQTRVSLATAKWLCLATCGYALVQAAMLANARNPIRRMLESAPLAYVGKISYGLYLYHYIILSAFGLTHKQISGEASMGRTAMALALCAALPVISFHTVEAFFRKLRVRLAP